MKYSIIQTSQFTSVKSQVEQLKKEIEEATLFIKDIENGKLDTNIRTGNDGILDGLAGALVSMRNKMIKLSDEERQRNWATEGLAGFVDILRNNNDDLKKLSDNILKNLVKYMKTNQGWLFILNDNNPDRHFLELTACYAYERKKFLEKEIEIGEGMVGQVFLERESVYMTQVPKTYSQITSGLGDAVPSAIFIVPLKVNEEIFGILEIGSFHEIPQYQRDFVEKLAESIASTIANVKVNERTKILLSQTQEQTEQLRSQEEEMRQNLEELHATQEEMERKSSEVDKRIDDLNSLGIASIDCDMNGTIQNANKSFLDLMGYTMEEIKSKHHSMFVDNDEAIGEDYKEFWRKLKKGIAQPGEFKRIGKKGKKVYVKACYSVMSDSYGTPLKVVALSYDITDKYEIQKQ
ncbi:MAG: PAS domain S-box protein [Opitutaceae bacterium]|nr:PAS domain S-box protein [Cytophagales bacterium]